MKFFILFNLFTSGIAIFVMIYTLYRSERIFLKARIYDIRSMLSKDVKLFERIIRLCMLCTLIQNIMIASSNLDRVLKSFLPYLNTNQLIFSTSLSSLSLILSILLLVLSYKKINKNRNI